MTKLPPFGVTAAMVWAIILVMFIIVSPPNAWWEPFAPRQFSALALQEAAYIPLNRDDSYLCACGVIRAWSRLAEAPPKERWFERILAANPTPAGQVLALAGLVHSRDGGPRLSASEQAGLPDSVRVSTLSGYSWWSRHDIRDQLHSGALAAHLSHAGTCDAFSIF